MSLKARFFRYGAVVATATSAIGLLMGVGTASATNDSVESTFPCVVPPYRGAICAETLSNVYQRAKPTSQSGAVVLVSKGTAVVLRCYSTGEVVNGNNVWYLTDTDADYPYRTTGWVTAAYLSTDKDPAWGVGHC